MKNKPWVHVGSKVANLGAGFVASENRLYDDVYQHETTLQIVVVRCVASTSKKLPPRIEAPSAFARFPGVASVFPELVREGDGTSAVVGPVSTPTEK